MVRFKDIRLIALDLDDTTLCSDGNLADKTREAIEAAISSGIEVVIASGRAFNSLPRAVAEICGIRYAITSNGVCRVCKNNASAGRRYAGLYARECRKA
ncbi:MAG: HAD hydrolase family protein [Oscillospiraceae bacterium]